MVVLLPPELALQIFEYLAPADLCSVARASQWCSALAIPHLYRHVVIHREKGGLQVAQLRHFRGVAALLLARPEVARHVRALTLHGPVHTGKNVLWHSRLHGQSAATFAHAALEDPFQRAIDALGLPLSEAKAWVDEALLDGNDDAVLGLVLPALTNLRRLDVELPHTPLYFTRVLRMSSAFDASHPWADVMCKSGDAATRGRRPSMFAGFLALPCIRRIFVHRVGSSFETADDVLSTITAHSSGVVHLEFKDCLFNTVDLALLLHTPRALRTFIYEAGNRQLAYCDVSIHHIRACLELQKDSLEDLWLDDYDDDLGIALEMKAPMPSVSTFTSLRRLRIASLFVMGKEGSLPVDLASFLPDNLHHLHLTRCEARFEALRSALQKFIPQRHRLRSLTLEGRFDSYQKVELGELYRQAQPVAPQMSFAVLRVPAAKYPLDPKWPERKWGMDEDITWADCQFDMLRRLPSEEINLA